MTHFNNINALDELKKEYRRLAMIHHPDRGGNVTIMQAINNEYEKLFVILKDRHNEEANTEGSTSRPIHETPEQFRNIILEIINLSGISIELCGSWIWVSGNTKDHKDTLKSLGFYWASKKSMWYWRSPEDAVQSRKGAKAMSYIRSKYGSEIISNDNRSLTA